MERVKVMRHNFYDVLGPLEKAVEGECSYSSSSSSSSSVVSFFLSLSKLFYSY